MNTVINEEQYCSRCLGEGDNNTIDISYIRKIIDINVSIGRAHELLKERLERYENENNKEG